MSLSGVPKLAFSDFCPPGHACHLSRVTYRAGERLADHDHGFAEIFWIAEGNGTHLTPARQEPLRAGAVGILGEGDVHGIRSAWGGEMILYNVAFESHHLREMAERYGLDAFGFADALSLRCLHYLSASVVRMFIAEYEVLERSSRADIALHAFLVRVLSVFAPGAFRVFC